MPPEKDRDTATGDRPQKFAEDRSRGFGDISAERQTDTLIAILSSPYRGGEQDNSASQTPSPVRVPLARLTRLVLASAVV